MDIHKWCTVPEAALARACFFYMDDISLEVVEEPPLSISTPLDEYYVGEQVPWRLKAGSAADPIKVQFVIGNRVISEMAGKPEAGHLEGEFMTDRLAPGIYTLRATGESEPETRLTQQQFILTPNPFDWPAPFR